MKVPCVEPVQEGRLSLVELTYPENWVELALVGEGDTLIIWTGPREDFLAKFAE